MAKKSGSKKNIRKRFRHCGRYGVRSEFAQVNYYETKGRRISKGEDWQRKYETAIPKYRHTNNKRSVHYLEALVQSNFGTEDILLNLPYDEEHLPTDEKDAKRLLANYIRRINRRQEKMGKGNAKWIAVTEVGKNGRIHHHVIIKCDLDRDTLEKLWGNGYANTKRLQPDAKEGLLPVVKYIAKEFIDDERPKNKRNWDCSKNLIKPWDTINDNPRMMSRKKYKKMQELPEDCEEMKKIIEGDNPGYELINMEKTHFEGDKWYFFCRLRLARNGQNVHKTVDKKTGGKT